MACLSLGNELIHSFIFCGPSCQLLCASPPSLSYLLLCIQGTGLGTEEVFSVYFYGNE